METVGIKNAKAEVKKYCEWLPWWLSGKQAT